MRFPIEESVSAFSKIYTFLHTFSNMWVIWHTHFLGGCPASQTSEKIQILWYISFQLVFRFKECDFSKTDLKRKFIFFTHLYPSLKLFSLHHMLMFFFSRFTFAGYFWFGFTLLKQWEVIHRLFKEPGYSKRKHTESLQYCISQSSDSQVKTGGIMQSQNKTATNIFKPSYIMKPWNSWY